MDKNDDIIKDKFQRNYQIVAENDMKIAYQSTVRGKSSREADKLGRDIGFVYYGIVFTIPFEDFPDTLLEFEPSFEKLLTEFNDCMPMPGGIIERHEIVDINTGDVHVMLRVPYIAKPNIIPELPEKSL